VTAMMGSVSPRQKAALSREEKKAQTRQKLLDAAATVFAHKGFAGASLDDVADEAGLTKGAVYSNFASKEELISALLEQRLGQPSLAFPKLISPHATQAEQAEQAAHMFMNLLANERETYLLDIEFMLYRARNPGMHDSTNYVARRDEIARTMEARAAAEGFELPMPAKDLTTALFAIGMGLALERMVNEEHVPEDLFGRVLGLIFGNVQPAGKDKRSQPTGKDKR